MVAIINTRIGGKNFVQAQVLPTRIAYFGDSMTVASIDYPFKVYGINGISNTNYAVNGAAVCTNTYAPTGGSQNLIDLYTIEIGLGYSGQLVSFAYLQNDLSNVNATWKSTYKAIVQAFITAGWPLRRLLLMNEPCIDSNAASRAQARTYIAQIASELGILFYDVYQRFVDTGVNDTLFADSIHPNDAGQEVWAQGYFQYLVR